MGHKSKLHPFITTISREVLFGRYEERDYTTFPLKIIRLAKPICVRDRIYSEYALEEPVGILPQ